MPRDLALERNGVLSRETASMIFQTLCWLKEASHKDDRLYDSIYMKCSEEARP